MGDGSAAAGPGSDRAAIVSTATGITTIRDATFIEHNLSLGGPRMKGTVR
ncbi:hypothetical protein MSEO_15980 [Mycobacterium seoulense]|uniref:Uncharacterized protein n=1 Tax=Mycobacterium seoulense TaxID=386911 RepID=A0A7I7NXC8_9MYCO|nr:hypothetical protein MSEO_15980 [Mycobacterium seoulense]